MAHAHLWTLNGRAPEACIDLDRWARWFETADLLIAQTTLMDGDLLVVTRFRPFSDRRGAFDPPPMLFETVVLGDAYLGEMLGQPMTRRDRMETRSYPAWAEAEAGHRQVVERYRQMVAAATSTVAAAMPAAKAPKRGAI